MGSAARPYSTALRAYAPTILDHLLTVTGAVHSFWHPQVRESVSERWRGVYLAPEMKAMVDPSHKPSPLDCGDPQVTDACSWLRHVRDATYECLALMCDAGYDHFSPCPHDISSPLRKACQSTPHHDGWLNANRGTRRCGCT